MSSSMNVMSRCLASCVLAARIAIVSGLVRHSGRPGNFAVIAYLHIREDPDMEVSVVFHHCHLCFLQLPFSRLLGLFG